MSDIFGRSFYTSELFLTILASVLLLPICLTRHYANLTFTASYSIVAIILVVLFVLIVSPFEARNRYNDIDYSELNWFNVSGTFAETGSIIYALGAAQATFPRGRNRSSHPPFFF